MKMGRKKETFMQWMYPTLCGMIAMFSGVLVLLVWVVAWPIGWETLNPVYILYPSLFTIFVIGILPLALFRIGQWKDWL